MNLLYILWFAFILAILLGAEYYRRQAIHWEWCEKRWPDHNFAFKADMCRERVLDGIVIAGTNLGLLLFLLMQGR